MTSAEVALELVDKTEANLKRIEAFGEDFITPSLNEWRYTIRHIIRASLLENSEVEWQRAVGHLKRAYFDSYDILLDCQLKVLKEVNNRYRGYANQVTSIIPEYPKYIQKIRAAQELHSRTGVEGFDRESYYNSLDTTVNELQEIIWTISTNADEIESVVRRAKIIYRSSVIAAGATIIGFLFHLGEKLSSWLVS